jgi:hypothetical protein
MSEPIKEFSERVGQYVAKHSAERWTGQIQLTVNMRDGGIANTEVFIKTRLPELRVDSKKVDNS